MDKRHFEMLARYNQWMNRKLYAVCADIPDTDRKKDMGAFFKSIHGTLNHLLYGDIVWMKRFTGQSIDGISMGDKLYSAFDEMRRAREQMDREIVDWTATLEADWLEKDFEFTSKIDNKPRSMPAWAAVTHLFNHQTHHRGQLTTLIKQLGYEPGVTDIPWLPEFNQSKESG